MSCRSVCGVLKSGALDPRCLETVHRHITPCCAQNQCLVRAGESEMKVRQLFEEAAQSAPCIVFIGAPSIWNIFIDYSEPLR